MSGGAAVLALRVVLTIALFVLLMPGLVTFVIALSMSWDEPSAYYRWGSFLHMMRLGYRLGALSAGITGLGVIILSRFVRGRPAFYGLAGLLGALAVVSSAVIRNGMSADLVGFAVAGVLGALASLLCTALARHFKFLTPAPLAVSA